MVDIRKQPAEAYPIAFEYYNRLPFGLSLVSAVGSAHNTTDDVDATGIILFATTGTIVDTQARFKIQAGVTGKTYKLTCKATLSDSSILEDEVNVIVEEL